MTRSADEQAGILLEELDDCDEYFADCAAHDEIESRPDRAMWYREETFNRVAELTAKDEQNWKEMGEQAKELSRMQSCDVNVLSPP